MPAQSPVLHAPLVPWVPVEEPANGAYRLASDLATLVGLHQNRLSLLALRLCDLNRHGDGDQASLDCCDQPLLASFEECDDVAHPASRAPNLFGDLGIAVATLGEIADLGHKIDRPVRPPGDVLRSEEHTSELQSLMRISYAVFCLKKKTHVTMQLCTANAGQHTTETHNH